MTPEPGSIRVLSLGASGFFVAHLCRELRRRRPDLAFVVGDYTRTGDAVPFDEDEAFAGHIRTREFGFDLGTAAGLLRASGQRHLYRRLWATTFFRGRPLARDAIDYAIRSARLGADVGGWPRFAIWHVHSCSPHSLSLADTRPRGVKLVCSFWGSDLLRAPDAETQWHVRHAIRQADAITVQSVELREIMLSLYGRDLVDRVHICRFPAHIELLDSLDRLPPGPAGRRHARARMELPQDACVVAIGKDGSPTNQQAQVVDRLATLPATIRDRLFLVFPWGYGASAAEAEALARQVQARGLRCRIQERFLVGEELACSRAVADVTIHVPISDALSHLIIEALYAGSRVVTGAWLPYGPFRRSGLELHEVEDLAQLPAAVGHAIASGPPDEDELAAIRRRVRDTASPAALLPAWLRMYRAVLGEDAHG